MVFSCRSKSISLCSLSISPMVSLYLLSFYANKWRSYNIDLFLEVAHFGEHQLYITLLALLLELGNWLLQVFNFFTQITFNSFQGHQVSSLPFVFFCVVVCLLLHFLSLIQTRAMRINGETLWVFWSRHMLIFKVFYFILSVTSKKHNHFIIIKYSIYSEVWMLIHELIFSVWFFFHSRSEISTLCVFRRHLSWNTYHLLRMSSKFSWSILRKFKLFFYETHYFIFVFSPFIAFNKIASKIQPSCFSLSNWYHF